MTMTPHEKRCKTGITRGEIETPNLPVGLVSDSTGAATGRGVGGGPDSTGAVVADEGVAVVWSRHGQPWGQIYGGGVARKGGLAEAIEKGGYQVHFRAKRRVFLAVH